MARARVVSSDVETLPESDVLEGWPHPRHTARIFGHSEPEAEFLEALASHRFHHAWLLTGERGVGKAAFAYRLARFLLNEAAGPSGAPDSLSIPEDSRTYRQVAGLSQPGLLVIRRSWDTSGKKFRQTIAVDDVRKIRHFLQRTAVTPWRIVIVDSADDLNLNSANALLKSLEEPPARTIFLLISSSPGRLLPTIRSRCRTIRFEALRATDMQAAITAVCAASDREPPKQDQLDMLTSLAKGSPRSAMQLLDGGGLALFQSLLTLLESLPRLDRQALHKLIPMVSGRNAVAHEMAFNLLEEMLAETIRCCAAGSSAPRRFSQLKRFPELLNTASLADWAELWETLREARGEAERLNLDKGVLTLTAFEKIARLSQKTASSALQAS
jgi:DNA polymerase-3 subunit delta'